MEERELIIHKHMIEHLSDNMLRIGKFMEDYYGRYTAIELAQLTHEARETALALVTIAEKINEQRR